MIPQTPRLYYSIREACDQTGLPASNIRYWEDQFSEFEQMQTRIDPQGNHHYTEENIRFIKLLRYLRDERKITRIEAMKQWIRSDESHALDRQQMALELLSNARKELLAIRDMI